MWKRLFVLWLLMNVSVHADTAPEFVKEGVYVGLSGAWYPHVFLKNAKGTIQMHFLARKEGVSRCYATETTPFKPQLIEGKFQNLFTNSENGRPQGIQKDGDGGYFFLVGDEAQSGKWADQKVKFVRVGDEKSAHRILTDFPACDKVVGVESRPRPSASKPVPLTDPLIVDLGSTGIKLGVPRAAVEFDIDSDGFTEKLTWPDDSGAYFVAVDRNSNGIIDDGSELFGTATLGAWARKHDTGFGALRSFDANDDGWIDQRDGIFDSLRLWNDTNRNGKSEPEELHSLCELEVKAIAGSCTDLGESDDYGNCKSHESYVQMVDNSLRKIYDVIFITPH